MSESHRRAQPFGTRPRVSFVVAWQGCPNELSRRLRAWDRWVDDGVDVVVACSYPPVERQRIMRAHPGTRVVHADVEGGLQGLRHVGVSAAHGDVVVIVDDTIAWSASWRDHLPSALGGAMCPDRGARWTGYETAARIVHDATLG